MRGLDRAAAAKLAKVAGLLGSDFDGERAVAAAVATRILRDNNLTWTDLVLGGATARTNPAPAQTAMVPQEIARRILSGQRYLLSSWEVGFTENLARWRERATPKQIARLAQLCADLKVRGTGR